MNKLIKRLAAIGAAMTMAVLSGCSESVHTIDINEVNLELESYKFTDTNNIHFECNPIIQDFNKLYTITSTIPRRFEDEKSEEEAVDKVVEYTDRICGKKINKTQVVKDGMDSFIYNDESENMMSISVSANKSFDIATPNYFAIQRKIYENNSECGSDPETYIVFNGENEVGKTYDIEGKSVNVQKAADYALKWATDNFSDMFNKIEDGLEIVDSIAIKANDNLHYYFIIRLAYKVDNVRMNENGFIDLDPNPNANIDFVRPSYIDIGMSNEYNVIKAVSMFRFITEDKKEITSIMPLSYAVQRASTGLAPNLNYSVKDVRLKYVMHSTSREDTKPHELRPMWCFELEVSGGNAFYSVMTKDIFVDALDGTMYLSDTAKMRCEISK